MIKFDKKLSDVEVEAPGGGEDGFPPMPIGDYMGVITEAEETTSKNGNDMIKLVITLKGNEHYDGKMMFHYIVQGEYFLQSMVRMLTAMNQSTDIDHLDASTLTGIACKFHTKHEEYNDEVQDKIHYFVAIDPIQQAQIMGGSKTVSNTAGVSDNDDIPF